MIARTSRSRLLNLLVLVFPLAAIADDLCDWKDKTKPPLLQGHEGNSESDTYWFSHLADVDQAGGKQHFVFAIHNLHPQRLLPAEWRRSDGQVQVAFSRIAPGKCGSNDFETTNSYTEDSKAFIKYGPILQLTKANASLYVEVVRPSQAPGNVGPNLKSCLRADLQNEQTGKIEGLHLEFGSEREGTAFTYTVINRGSDRVRFEIPQLAETLSKLAATGRFTTPSEWTKVNGAFVAEANNQSMKQVVKGTEAVGSSETQVAIKVLSDTGETIAAGKLTVYLPVVR